MDFVLYSVETGHEQRRIGQMRVGGQIWKANCHTLGIWARCKRYAAKNGRAIARGIGQKNWRRKAENQPLVGIGQ